MQRPLWKEEETDRLLTLERSSVQRHWRATRVVRGAKGSAIVEQHLHCLLLTCNTGQTPSTHLQHVLEVPYGHLGACDGSAWSRYLLSEPGPSEPALPLASTPCTDLEIKAGKLRQSTVFNIEKLKTVDFLKFSPCGKDVVEKA